MPFRPTKFHPKTTLKTRPRTLFLEALEDRLLYNAAPAVPEAAPEAQPNETVQVEATEAPMAHEPVLSAPSGTSSPEQTTLSSAVTQPSAPVQTALSAPSQSDHTRLEVIIIDPSIEGADALAQSLKDSAANGVQVEILKLDPALGLNQISEALNLLSADHKIDAIHLVSYAQDGELWLGTSHLKTSDFDEGAVGAVAVGDWRSSLAENADILLYGCNLASGPSGLELIHKISQASGADVAASSNPTGSVEGADWVFEFNEGVIETHILSSTLEIALDPPTPVVAITAPASVPIGGTFDVSVTFDNTALTGVGYGPYIDVFIDRTGADGIAPGTPAANTYDGFTALASPPTYLGAALNYSLLTLNDSANGGLGILHPYAVDNTGAAVYIKTTDPALGGKYQNGDQLLVIEMPFGSFAPTQPPAEVKFKLTLSNLADLGTPVIMDARGGFRYGTDPLNNPGTDPGIVGALTAASTNVNNSILKLNTIYLGPENETATGPNYVRQYQLVVDIADGQTINNLHIVDVLAANGIDALQFTGTANVTTYVNGVQIANTIISAPSTTTPGGTLDLLVSTVTGTSAIDDVVVTFSFFVPRTDTAGGQGNAVIIDATSGTSHLVPNQAYAYGTWNTLDARDPDIVVGAETTASTGSTTPDADPEHQLEVQSIAVQKSFTNVTQGGSDNDAIKPGDILQFSLDVQVSDYFAFENIHVNDLMSDGLALVGGFTPTLTVNEHGTSFTFSFTGGTWTLDTSDVGNDTNPTTGGTTALDFNISALMLAMGLNGNLVGGALANETGSNPPLVGSGNGPLPWGATTAQIVYRARVLDKFTDTYPSGEASLNRGDLLTNDATVSGSNLVVTNLTPNGNTVSDDTALDLTIAEPVLVKSIYAINGSTNLTPYTDANGAVNLQPGDVVTYRLVYSLPTGDVEDLRFTDYLPLPIFNVSNPNADGTSGGLAEWGSFNTTVSATPPPAGGVQYGPTHTLINATNPPGTPVISIDPVSNALTFTIGDSINTTNNPLVVDILFSVTINDTPFADGLYLTNQVQSGEQNTQNPGVVNEATNNAIVQIVLNEPVVNVFKGVVASTQVTAPVTAGGLTFANTSGNGFTGTLAGAANAAAIGALNLTTGTLPDTGDTVRYAIVVQNTGRSDAFDVKVQDTIRTDTYLGNFADVAAFVAGTNFKVYDGAGTLQTLGVDYTLTWNNATKVFEVTLTDPTVGQGSLNEGVSASGGSTITTTNGSNSLVILYDLTVAAVAQSGSTVQNTAKLTNYAGQNNGTDHTTTDKTDSADVRIRLPAVQKTLVGTEITGPNNNAANEATIGEIVTYTVTVTVGEGTTQNVQIVDTMDAGLAFVGVTATSSSGGVTYSGSLTPSVTNSGGTLTFNIGNVTNANTNNAVSETIVITYQVIVLNTIGNQATTTLNNSAALGYSWTNDDGKPDALPTPIPDTTGSGTITVSASNVTVVEPTIQVSKTVDKPNADAGDALTYTITLSVPSGSATAYDISLSDVLPSQLTGASIFSVSATGSGTITVTGGTLASSFQISGGTLQLTPGRNIDMQANTSITITVTGTLSNSTGTGIINNDAVVKWSSLDGVPGTRSSYNTNSTERTGADSNPTGNNGLDPSLLNNYAQSARATTTVAVAAAKTIVSTSETETSGTNVTPGEIVRYRISVDLPEGVVNGLQITDNIPAGMAYVPGSVVLITTGYNGTVSLASTVPGSGGNFQSGTDVVFNFGTATTVVDNIGTNNTISIEFDVVVLDVGSNSGYAPATTLPNSATYSDSNTAATAITGTPTVTVAEPKLTVLPSVVVNGSGSVGDAGDPLTYTTVVKHNDGTVAGADSTLDAYDVTYSDVIPSQVTATSFTATLTGGVDVSSHFELIFNGSNYVVQTKAGDSIDLPLGVQLTVVVNGVLNSTVTPNLTISNTPSIGYTNLDGNVSNSTLNTIVGTYDPSGDVTTDHERLYSASASVLSTVPQATVSKSLFNTSESGTSGANVSIGELVTYAVRVTFPEGSLPGFAVVDEIPAGLQYVSFSIVTASAASGGLLAGDFNGTIPIPSVTGGTGDGGDVTFTFGSTTTTGDNITGNNSFIILVTARVLDVVGNEGILPGQSTPSNRATLDVTGDGILPVNSGNVPVTVVEPRVVVTKTNDDVDGVVVPGQVLTYTLVISNLAANGATGTAYDLRIYDLIPAGLSNVGNFTFSTMPDANTSAGNTLNVVYNELALGGTITITFQATATGTAGTNIDNNVRVTYDSLDGNDINTQDPNETVVVTDSGDRDYGPSGVEAPTPTIDDPHQDTNRVTIGALSIGDFVWLDLDGDGVQDAGEAGLGGVTVTLLYAGNDDNFATTADNLTFNTTTSALGAYSFGTLAAGNYRVTVDTSTLFAGASATFDVDGVGSANVATFTLSTSSRTDVDFGYRGDVTVGDKVWHDQNGNGALDAGEQGIPNVSVTARWDGSDGILNTGDDLLFTTQTDASGNFLFNFLPSGVYVVTVDPASLPGNASATYDRDGIGTPNSSGAIPLSSGTTDLAFDFGYRGNSSIGDQVWYDQNADGVKNALETGIAGATVTLLFGGNDGDLTTTADNITYTTTTDSNGNYLFGNLFGGDFINGTAANYRVTVTPPAAYTQQTYDADGTGTANQSSLRLDTATANLLQDFGYAGTASLGNFAWTDLNGNGRQDAGEPGLDGVSVGLWQAGADNIFNSLDDVLVATTTTAGGGLYSFNNLVAGNYQIRFTTPTGMTSTTPDSPISTDASDSDGTPFGDGTARSGIYTLAAGATNTTVDAGFYTAITLGDRVYFDVDGDGVQDAGEAGISGVVVTVTWFGVDGVAGGGNDVTFTTMTGANGAWSVSSLPPGTYSVGLDTGTLPNGFSIVTDSVDNGVLSATNPVTISTSSGVNRSDIDFGLRGNASIGNLIWNDLNGNGAQDAGESGIPNATVNLTWYGQDGVLGGGDDVLFSTVTNASGQYLFSNLPAGVFDVSVVTTTLPENASPTFDFDGTGTPNTAQVPLAAGQNFVDADFGYRGTGTIGDRVWYDFNGDGVQDASEPGLSGVAVSLLFGGADGILGNLDDITYTTTTGTNGSYSFGSLFGGLNSNYRVTVTPPAGSAQTYDADGTGSANQSLLTLANGATNNAQDFGYNGGGSIGDRIWNDLDGDGVQDAGEFGLSGVGVQLEQFIGGSYVVISSTSTGADGIYNFAGLMAADYRITVTTPPASSTRTYDLDGVGTSDVALRTLGTNVAATDVDFGYQGSASIGDYVWFDQDDDGVQDAAEPPIPGVRVFIDVNGDGSYTAATDPFATTNSAGAYQITGLVAGTYTVVVDTSTLPAGLNAATYDFDGTTLTPDGSVTVTLTATESRTDLDFGYKGNFVISGVSYHDQLNNGDFDGTDTGIGGVTIELIFDSNNSGTFDAGDLILSSITTAADGSYQFEDLITGSYLIRETQPAGFGNGSENSGNLGAVTITAIPGTYVVDFGNTTGSLAGRVYLDNNNDGVENGADAGIAGASVRLEWSGLDGIFGNSDDRSVTILTDANGAYLFNYNTTAGFLNTFGDTTGGLLSTGSYRVVEVQPSAYRDGAETAGNASVNAGGVSEGSVPGAGGRGGADQIGVSGNEIQIAAGENATGYTFAEITPSTLSGTVYYDANENGLRDLDEAGLAGVTLTLTGTNYLGQSVTRTVVTDSTGTYSFADLDASDATGYSLLETQPAAYKDGQETIGSAGGFSLVNDLITNIVLDTGENATDYHFGELNSFTYAYDQFQNFALRDQGDDWNWYSLESVEPYAPPILPLMPMYSGEAEPGSTLVLKIYNAKGEEVGQQTVMVDTGGNWLATFASTVLKDYPQSVVITQTVAPHNDHEDYGFNLRTYFSPAINSSHFFFEQFDIGSVFSRNATNTINKLYQGALHPVNFGDRAKFDYETLSAPGTPSGY